MKFISFRNKGLTKTEAITKSTLIKSTEKD